jgi:hypothetical protein
MKYMLLIYDNPDTREKMFSGDAGEQLLADVDAVIAELTASGELLGTEALADPSNTRTVKVADGVPVVTDGPFIESKEHMGGYLLVECDSLERATEIAARWPSAPFAPLEVRPVMDAGGEDM